MNPQLPEDPNPDRRNHWDSSLEKQDGPDDLLNQNLRDFDSPLPVQGLDLISFGPKLSATTIQVGGASVLRNPIDFTWIPRELLEFGRRCSLGLSLGSAAMYGLSAGIAVWGLFHSNIQLAIIGTASTVAFGALIFGAVHMAKFFNDRLGAFTAPQAEHN